MVQAITGNDLPAASIADKVNQLLSKHNRLIITAPPGAGKSTLLPLTILNGLKSSGKILMLEPRRLAARQIAERMAEMIGEPIGKTIGYRIRFENKVSKETRIEVVTEGILSRKLIKDPTIEDVQVVIFDEFHERSLSSDAALALTREAQQIIRPDLKIVLMSATIDTSSISTQLDAQVIESDGRMFPVEVFRTEEEVVPLIRRAHKEHEGDILVFLPGEAEIKRCKERLGESLLSTQIFPLYGMLSQQEQKQAIAPSQPGKRKVVLATPIAETSLTIQGVRVVIDSGLYRKMVFNPHTSLSHLQTAQISMDMATQRMGRAGRLAAGVCYRMWSLATEHRMAENRTPEILEADLAPLVLEIAAWGSENVLDLPWITPPPTAAVAQAIKLLQLLGALDENGKITPRGRLMADLPCHPRISRMLLTAQTPVEKQLACNLAAIIEEKDPLAGNSDNCDIRLRFECMTKRMRQIAEQYAHLLENIKLTQQTGNVDPLDAGALLAYAYPERIAKAEKIGTGRFRLANGETAFVNTDDEIAAHDWIAIASMNSQTGSSKIFLAAPVEQNSLEPLQLCKEEASWDSKKGMIVAQREFRIGNLIVRTEPIRCQNAAHIIGLAAQKEGRSMLDFNDKVLNLQRRVAAVSSWHPEMGLPDLSTENVLLSAPEWLPFYIGKATTVQELKKIDLCNALWGLLNYEQQLQVDCLAPTHIQVPTGSRIQIEYRQGAELPILRVRLQECFGMVVTPMVDNGKKPVLLELLSPGFKPVQLTQDLHNFWKETYFEVRKELKRRYPKHAWPDNPLEAEAVRGTKRNSK